MKITVASSPRGTNNERPIYGVDVPLRTWPLIQIYLLIHNTIGPLLAEVTPLAMLCGSNASTLGPFQIRAVTLYRFQHRPGTGFWGLNGPSADHAE